MPNVLKVKNRAGNGSDRMGTSLRNAAFEKHGAFSLELLVMFVSYMNNLLP